VTRRLGALLTLALAAVLLVPTSPSHALATMTVVTVDDPTYPQKLSTSVGRVTDIKVTADGATDVVVTFSGAGLSFNTPVVNLGTVSGEKRTTVDVKAVTAGFHTLDVQVTSSNSSTVSASLPYMWAPGGTPIPATGDLTGLYYGNVDGYSSTGGVSYQDRDLLTFLDGATAYVGNPPKGRPRCRTASATGLSGCVAYRYDTSTGLVQIGDAIGRVMPTSVYTNGIGTGDDSDGELFSERVFSERVDYPGVGKRYGGNWEFSYGQFMETGPTFVRLSLRKNGRFELQTAFANGEAKTKRGTYALTAPGRLRLKGGFGTELHTLAVRTTNKGKAKPGKGIWLTLVKGKGTYVYVVPMKPVA
jgi:hypothetical protein